MSFDFHEELHLRTLKVCNHPADKRYSSVSQRLAPYKSDDNEKTKGNYSIGLAIRLLSKRFFSDHFSMELNRSLLKFLTKSLPGSIQRDIVIFKAIKQLSKHIN